MDLDPVRIAVRVVVAYVLLLVLLRLSGKHSVKQSNPLDFTLVMILGDMVDDAVWAEVHVSLFVAGAVSLVAIHTGLDFWRWRSAA